MDTRDLKQVSWPKCRALFVICATQGEGVAVILPIQERWGTSWKVFWKRVELLGRCTPAAPQPQDVLFCLWLKFVLINTAGKTQTKAIRGRKIQHVSSDYNVVCKYSVFKYPLIFSMCCSQSQVNIKAQHLLHKLWSRFKKHPVCSSPWATPASYREDDKRAIVPNLTHWPDMKRLCSILEGYWIMIP